MKNDKRVAPVNLVNLPKVSTVEDSYTPEPFDIAKHREPHEIVSQVMPGVWAIKPRNRNSKAFPVGPLKVVLKDGKEIPYISYNVLSKDGEWTPRLLTTHPAEYLDALSKRHEATKNIPAEVLASWQD